LIKKKINLNYVHKKFSNKLNKIGTFVEKSDVLLFSDRRKKFKIVYPLRKNNFTSFYKRVPRKYHAVTPEAHRRAAFKDFY
jgi:hypothetical protein